MLTTSPVITSPNSSKNVSPRPFQYVPARTSQGSPSLPSSSRSSRQNTILSQSPEPITASPTVRTSSGLMSSPSDVLQVPAAPVAAGGNSASGAAPSTGIISTQPVDSNDAQVVAVHRPPNDQKPQPDAQTSSKKPQSTKRRPNSPEHALNATPDDQTPADRTTGSQDQTRPAQRHRALPADPKILPLAYEHCAVTDMVVLIAHMLSELIETNDALALRSGSLTRFHSR